MKRLRTLLSMAILVWSANAVPVFAGGQFFVGIGGGHQFFPGAAFAFHVPIIFDSNFNGVSLSIGLFGPSLASRNCDKSIGLTTFPEPSGGLLVAGLSTINGARIYHLFCDFFHFHYS
jgi:hypothetical protein